MADGEFDLRGHVSVVTGGNSGVGLGMAEGLARAGADVCIWGTNEAKNAAADEQLARHGGRVQSIICDVGDEDQVIAAMKRVREELGRLDSCFANAGISSGFDNPRFIDSTLAEFRTGLRVNLDGVYLTLREAARVLVEQEEGGSLVATSSIGILYGSPREHAYTAAKAGVISIVRCLAVELARHRIRANAVLPGWTESGLTDRWLENPAVSERILPRIPMRRWGKASEWGGVATYLASEASSFQTGDMLRIDGGYGVY